jgi:hypothetical protein
MLVGVLTLTSCAGEETVITIGSPDGVLDCRRGEIPRAADVLADGESEQQAVESALVSWLEDGARLAKPDEAEVWSAVIDGNEIASAGPEREGDGGWVVAAVQECGRPDTGPAEIDGSIDCAAETVWTQQASLDGETPGDETPEKAIRSALEAYLNESGGEVVMVSDHTGSVVVDEREQIVAFATRADAGGWVAATLMGCDELPG